MMCDSSCFDRLPVEILEKIFSFEDLSYKDLCSLASTCSFLRNVVTGSNSLWRTKLFQTFSRLSCQDIFNTKWRINWKSELQQRISIGHEVRARLDLLGVSCRSITELSYRQFNPFTQIAKRHNRGVDYIIDELMGIVNDENRYCNLTRKYYGLKILCYMQQYRLCKIWDHIVKLPEQKQIMEEGAFFIGQWQYPAVDVIYSDIRSALDDLAKEVMVLLNEQSSGKHPILKVDRETLKFWRDNVLSDNQWTPEHCKQIILATSNLIFVQMGFKVRRCIYQNLPINKELNVRECDPLTIGIIYEGILRRLGVKCYLISMSCHFLLGWSESYIDGIDGRNNILNPSYFIDVRDEGVIVKKSRCSTLEGLNKSSPFPSSQITCLDTSIKMVRCMASKMFYNCMQNEAHTFDHVSRLRSTLEMVLVTEPTSFNNYIQLMDFYDINRIEIDPELLDQLGNCVPNLTPDQQNTVLCFMNSRRPDRNHDDILNEDLNVVVKKRLPNSEVKFAVGLVMQHKQYGYKCVVYGWDQKCAATPDWMQTMRVHRLQHRQYQPFYNVLVEDGSLRYAAQENLRLVEEECEVKIPEVGRYFVKWCGRYYEPTPIKSAEYPDDNEYRDAILKWQY